MQVFLNEKEISGITLKCKIEKSISAAGAQATVEAACVHTDYFCPKINPECGDSIRILDRDSEVFIGFVERVSFSSDNLSLTMVCLDRASHLAKNELYGAFSGRPSDIAAKVCGKLSLPLGEVWQKGGTAFIAPTCALSAFGIIRKAYDDQCIISWEQGAVAVKKPGEPFYIPDRRYILHARAEHSSLGVVNETEIIGYKGRKDGQAKDAESIKSFGLRRRVFALAGPRATARRAAQSHLQGMSRTASATLWNNSHISLGNCLELNMPEYGVGGRFIVTSLCHSAEYGGVITTLTLKEATA